MELNHLAVILLFIALLAATLAWWRLYRRLGPNPRPQGRAYRRHQVLVALIALLAIVLVMVIVLSSDPGNPGDHLSLP